MPLKQLTISEDNWSPAGFLTEQINFALAWVQWNLKYFYEVEPRKLSRPVTMIADHVWEAA